MFAHRGRLLAASALLLLIGAFTLPVTAQTVNDAYQVNYFSDQLRVADVSAPDQFVRIINTGQIGSPIDPATNQGTVCADIYVFDTNQEMLECCSCPLTANALLTLSVGYDLTFPGRTLTGVMPSDGVIKIVADAGCDARNITTPVPGGLRAFATHLQIPLGAVVITNTETEFQPAPLTDTERAFLGNACSFVQYLGSGRGVCNCGVDMD